MMLRKMAAALLLLSAAAPTVAADDAPDAATTPAPPKAATKKKPKKAKKPASPHADEDANQVQPPPGVEAPPVPPPMVIVAPAAPTPAATPKTTSKLPTEQAAAAPRKFELNLSDATPTNLPPNPNDLAPVDLDAICVYPFEPEGSETDPGSTAPAVREEIHGIFVDIAHRAHVTVKEQPSPGEGYGINDTQKLSDLGVKHDCGAMLVGRVTRYQNGFSLRARFIKTGEHAVELTRVDQVTSTTADAEWRAWAQGQACHAFGVSCPAAIELHADRDEMNVQVKQVKETTLTRAIETGTGKYKEVQKFGLRPGVYSLEASMGPYNAKPLLNLPIGVDKTQIIYVRLTKDGELKLADHWLQPSEDPPKVKVPFILGLVGAGLGVVAEGFAVEQYEHSQSLANGAADNYNANGYYKPSDIAAVSSARTAHTNSNIAAIVGGVLIVAGAVVALVNHP